MSQRFASGVSVAVASSGGGGGALDVLGLLLLGSLMRIRRR